MKFGEWLKTTRISQNLLLEDVAKKSAVTAATISRIENQKSEPVVETAAKLVNVLSTPKEALGEMGIALADYDRKWGTDNEKLGLREIESWISYVHSNEKEADAFLQRWLLDIEREFGSTQNYQMPSIATMMECLSRGQNCVKWPPSLPEGFVIPLYQNQELITFIDMGCFIRQIRVAKGLSLRDAEKITGLQDSLLQRIENGEVWSIKIDVLFKINEMIADDGFFVLAYWQAAMQHLQLRTMILDLGKEYYKDQSPIIARVYALVGLYRWTTQMSTSYGTYKYGQFLNELFEVIRHT